jgi:hypothetical protein
MNTSHPLAAQVSEALLDAATTMQEDARVSGAHALDQATADRLVRIIADRRLERMGFDVLFWTEPDAASVIAALQLAARPFELSDLYGPSAEAIVGILRACVESEADVIRSVGYQLTNDQTLYEQSYVMAYGQGVGRLMADVCSDVHFACAKDAVDTPAKVQSHLRGVRGFELAAMYYVLAGVGNGYALAYPDAFLGAVQRMFFPDWPRV